MLRPLSGARKRHALLAVITLLLSSMVAAVAMTAPGHSTPVPVATLFNAIAEVEVCPPARPCGLLSISLAADWDGEGSLVCVTVTSGSLVERGCTHVDTSIGAGNDAITSADLPETVINLYETGCNDRNLCQDILRRTITLSGVWAASGEAMHVDRSTGGHYGACTWPDNTAGAVRTASIDLVIDGEPVLAFGNIRLERGMHCTPGE